MLRAIWVTAIVIAYVVVVGPPLLLYTRLTRQTDRLYRAGMLGARLALWLAGVRLEVHGGENILRAHPALYMANHQSNCDPPALLPLLPPVLVMVKKEFFRVPIMGSGMTRRGFIAVDRRDRDRARAAIERAVASMRAGNSFLVFPEGTRSPDGRLQAFKKGPFILAIEAAAPIVPISISGAGKVMPKGKFVIHPGRIRITVHSPIPTAGVTLHQRQDLMERTRKAIRAGLEPEEQ